MNGIQNSIFKEMKQFIEDVYHIADGINPNYVVSSLGHMYITQLLNADFNKENILSLTSSMIDRILFEMRGKEND